MHGSELTRGTNDYEMYCNTDYVCNKLNNDTISYEIDWEHPHSLRNWIESFDLLCASHLDIGAMGMYFFLGQAITCLIIPRLQDTFGRKRVFLFCSVINLYTLLTIWGLPDHSDKKHGKTSKLLLDALFFLNGLATPGRQLTGYTYFQELFPDESQNLAGTIQMVAEGVVQVLLTYYWMKVGFSWRWTVVLAIVMNVVGIILTLVLLPDSPKWLYETKQYKKCVDSVFFLAEWNNVREFRPSQSFYKMLETDSDDDEPKNLEKAQWINRENSLTSMLNSLSMLMSHKTQKQNLISMIMIWISATFCYYLIAFEIKYLHGDIFENAATSCFSEIVAVMLSGIMLDWIGFKKTLNISYILAFAGMFFLLIT